MCVDILKNIAIIFNCMDMHNEVSMGLDGLRAETAHCTMVVGAKQLRKALAGGKARRVYLARNADPAITQPIEALCRQNGVSCAWVSSMKDLGQAAGIEVGAAAAAALY